MFDLKLQKNLLGIKSFLERPRDVESDSDRSFGFDVDVKCDVRVQARLVDLEVKDVRGFYRKSYDEVIAKVVYSYR